MSIVCSRAGAALFQVEILRDLMQVSGLKMEQGAIIFEGKLLSYHSACMIVAVATLICLVRHRVNPTKGRILKKDSAAFAEEVEKR